MSSRRSNRVVRDDADSADDDGSPHRSVTVKVPSSKLRQATRNGGGSKSRGVSEAFEGGEMLSGKRNRGGKKKYVVDSSDDDDEDEEEPQLDDDEEDEDMDEDAEGEDDMDVDAEGDDVDAEGEEDAEGDVDMDLQPAQAAPTIKVSRNGNSRPAARAAAKRIVPNDDDDDDDDDLSDPVDSDAGDQTMGMEEEEDAEGEEDVDLDAEGEDAGDLDSLDGSEQDEPDLSKMSRRQRARFEEKPQDFMELSNEVQAKKVFTQEEQNMRRQEMARRRRNLSEKRNEEVKMETINKLLKKQAPKVNKKAAAAAAAAESTPEGESSKVNPAFIRWTSNKEGCRVSVPTEIVEGPVGKVFAKKGLAGSKMVEEVA